uniref:Pancreatic trypsin inhibitor n=1 Tax=Rhipicephalus zambeziensis TaxID=60191 RepID=A0A224YKD0_9ACAR
MSLTTLILSGVVILAALEEAMSCSTCCGVCPEPNCVKTRIQTVKTHATKTHYFKKGQKCTAVMYEGCKGNFYTTENECKTCCKASR